MYGQGNYHISFNTSQVKDRLPAINVRQASNYILFTRIDHTLP